MKTLILLSTIVVFGVLSSCEKEDEFEFYVQIDSNNPQINEEIAGIVYSFYLLDENGEKANTFYAGENFTIHFSLLNSSNEDYYYLPDFVIDDHNKYGHIYDSDDTDYGRSFVRGYIQAVGRPLWGFDSNKLLAFEVPWIFPSDTSWEWNRISFYSIDKQTLSSGDYYTSFSSQFEFYHSNDMEKSEIFNLSFKINFKIL